jgi:hypothetical protein
MPLHFFLLFSSLLFSSLLFSSLLCVLILLGGESSAVFLAVCLPPVEKTAAVATGVAGMSKIRCSP